MSTKPVSTKKGILDTKDPLPYPHHILTNFHWQQLESCDDELNRNTDCAIKRLRMTSEWASAQATWQPILTQEVLRGVTCEQTRKDG